MLLPPFENFQVNKMLNHQLYSSLTQILSNLKFNDKIDIIYTTTAGAVILEKTVEQLIISAITNYFWKVQKKETKAIHMNFSSPCLPAAKCLYYYRSETARTHPQHIY